MRIIIVILILALAPVPAMAKGCVILLHGLARTEASFVAMELALEGEHFEVVRPGYPSTTDTVAALADSTIPAALAACEGQKVHFVTHSMGGILVREWLTRHDIPNLGHVVMLGTPNQGTALIDRFADQDFFVALNGPAGVQLGTGPNSVPRRLPPVTYSTGVIAGTQSLNPIFSAFIEGPDDGKVSVASTRVEGMADHLILPVTHTFMMNNPRVIAETLYFLENGAFHGALTWVDGVRAGLGCADEPCLPGVSE